MPACRKLSEKHRVVADASQTGSYVNASCSVKTARFTNVALILTAGIRLCHIESASSG